MEQMRLFVGVWIAVSLTAYAQPKLSLDKMEVDLGIMYSGSKKISKFTVKNLGNEPLKITDVIPSCGCTTVKKPKPSIAPGETDYIEISFDATGYRSKAEKWVNITSNDPTSQYVAVKIVADIREELEPSTLSLLLWLGRIPVGQPLEKTVSFKNISGHDIAVIGASSSSTIVSVETEKKRLRPDDSVTVKVVVVPNKVGYSNEHFFLETDSPNQPKVDMKVSFFGLGQD